MTDLREIERLLALGQLTQAERLLEEMVAVDASQEALRWLAKIAFSHNDRRRAADLMEEARKQDPNVPELNFEYGVISLSLDHFERAAQAFRAEIALNPTHAGAHYNLAYALDRAKRPDEAIAAYRRLIELEPGNADAAYNLGNILSRQGKGVEAAQAYEHALRLRPGDHDITHNYAASLLGRGAVAAAEPILRSAIARHPQSGRLWMLLGNSLSLQGEDQAAIDALSQAAARMPDDEEALVNLVLALRRAGRPAAGRDLIVARRPAIGRWRSPALPNALALCYLDDGEATKAIDVLEDALAVWPDTIELNSNLGIACSALGYSERAIACFRCAHQLDPQAADVHSNLLFALSHSSMDEEEIFAEHLRFGKIQQSLAPPLPLPAPRPATGRRLRIGYLSPDLRDHAVSYFLEPVLHHHDRSRFEVYCYDTRNKPDGVTARLQSMVDHWRIVAQLPAEAAARIIAKDEIDILVDLAGHTALNGLPIMAWQPAPVQMTWLGYPYTTGMSRIAYRLGDGAELPGTRQPHSTEALVRLLDHPVLLPPRVEMTPSPSPSQSQGVVTFACVNRFQKVTDDCLRVWARLLRTVPGSRLLLTIDDIRDPDHCRAILARMDRLGLPPDRVSLESRRPLKGFLALLNNVDVALDPFPYSGGSTTFFSLWMGVPVVTLAQENQRSYTTAAILNAISLHETITFSAEQYVEAAARLANATAHRDHLRATLRARLLASPLMAPEPLVRKLEAIFAGAWNLLLRGRP